MDNHSTDTSHLSPATIVAIGIFRLHHTKQFYTDRMVKLEAETAANIPDDEFAEFVRITTVIQEGN